ncbi:MAG: Ig domain-containing protein [Nanoarchaeota archaeon]|nr:Ig domain-containing protein [Nanoarchaeota archaeon]
MITIQINNKYIELPVGFVFDLQLQSPLFNFDNIPGSFTYSFSIPGGLKSPHNARIFNNPENLDNRELLNKSYDTIINLHGYKIKGKLKFPRDYSISESSYSLSFKGDILDLETYLKETYLDDVAFDDATAIPNTINQELQIIKRNLAGNDPDVYVNGVHASVPYNTDEATSLNDLVTYINANSTTYKCTANYDGVVAAPDYIGITLTANFAGHSPDIFLYVFETSITSWLNRSEAGLSRNYTAGFDAFKQDICTFANTKINKFYPATKIQFIPYKNEKLTALQLQNNFNKLNSLAYQHYGESFVPFYFLNYVLKKIFSIKSYDISGEFFDNNELKQLLIYSLVCFSEFADYTANHDYPGSADYPDIEVGRQMPHVLLKDFLNAIKNKFGLAFIFDPLKKKIKVHTLKTVLNNTKYKDWTNKLLIKYKRAMPPEAGFLLKENKDTDDEKIDAIPDFSSIYNRLDNVADSTARNALTDLHLNDVVLQLDTNYFWIYEADANGDGAWTELGFNLYDLEIEDGSTEISPQFSTLINDNYTENSRIWKTPIVDQKRTSPFNDNENTSWKLRLLFYRGLELDSNNEIYPFANSDIYNYDGDQIGNYALNWDTDNGFYNIWLKDWLNFLMATKRVKFNIDLNIQDLIDLDWTKKIYLENHYYLLKNIRIQFNQSGVKPAELEAYQINEFDRSDFEEDCLYLNFDYETFDSSIADEQAISWEITIEGCCDAGIDKYELHSGALPDGLSLNPANGEISGTTSNTGTFVYVIKITDNCGNVRYKLYNVVVV